MAEAFNKKDFQGEKFLKLANSLKSGTLTDKEHSDLICLANTKLVIGKMIEVHCMAVAGKSYLIEMN